MRLQLIVLFSICFFSKNLIGAHNTHRKSKSSEGLKQELARLIRKEEEKKKKEEESMKKSLDKELRRDVLPLNVQKLALKKQRSQEYLDDIVAELDEVIELG